MYCVWINSDEENGSGSAVPFQHLSFIRLLCKYNLICYCSSFLATFICYGLAWESTYIQYNTYGCNPLYKQRTKASIFVPPFLSSSRFSVLYTLFFPIFPLSSSSHLSYKLELGYANAFKEARGLIV